ncbi:MAG: YiiX/YebB-like N1pC/P60 family cysteine hydrolase [Stenotrophomonas sp.]
MRLLVLLLLAGLLAACAAPAAPPPALAVTAQQQAVLASAGQLRDGDLVFRRGRDLMSSLVLRQGRHSRFSHVGMVLREGGQVLVVHAMPDEPGSPGGVRLEPLEQFLAPALASDAASYRLPGLQPGPLRGWLMAQQGKPFDMRFALSDASTLYCTELVMRGLAVAGVTAEPATVRVPLVAEPVIPPDALRDLPGLLPLAGA